jgi:hypothetical protein
MDPHPFHHLPALQSAALNRPPSPAPETTREPQPLPCSPAAKILAEPRIPKRIESQEPRTLEEAYLAIRKQPSLTIPAKRDMATVAQKLVDSLRLSAPDAPMIAYPDADVALLISILLVDLFGEPGQLLLAEFVHLYTEKGGKIPCEDMCATIQEAGQPEDLADFAHSFFDAFRRAGLWGTEPRISKRTADAVRQWDRMTALPEQGPERHALDLFFLQQGYRPGETLISNLRQYMVRTEILQTINGVTFGICRWRPFAALVEVFGDGVLAFVPPWLETKCVEISASRGDSGPTRDGKLSLAAELLAQQATYLKELCEIVNRKVLEPACRGDSLQLTPAEREALASLREAGRCDKGGLLDILRTEDGVASEQALPAVGEPTQTVVDESQVGPSGIPSADV